MTPLEIAQLLQILLPLGADLYNKIRSANTGAPLPSVETILAGTNQNWGNVIAAAKAEIAKLPAPAPVVQHTTVGDPVDLATQPGSLTPPVVAAALVANREVVRAQSDTLPQAPKATPEPPVVSAAKAVAGAILNSKE